MKKISTIWIVAICFIAIHPLKAVTKVFHVEVKILVIEAVGYLGLDKVTQDSEVDHIAADRIDLPADTHNDLVVMTVRIRRIALTEQTTIFVVGERRVMQPMRGIEVFATKHRYSAHRCRTKTPPPG